ncbi:MAG: TaqI-like C-terminal specificity domain-containing protein, partial [Betaproteobacteria bacterium]
ILLDHIYGVDIDTQAVEVTKLSLLLKVLEGETTETLQRQLFAKQRALPDLADNIKCGNSLIGPDFYRGKQLDLFDEDERLRVNVFDWSGKDGFREIMKSGGFDAVIGNPPYVRMEGFVDWKDYLRDKYTVHADRTDLYAYFVERGLGILRDGGLFSMILSNKFVKARYGKNLRNYICETAPPTHITDFAGLPVFVGATVRTLVITSQKIGQPTLRAVYCPPARRDTFLRLAGGTVTVSSHAITNGYSIDTSLWKSGEWSFERANHVELRNKLVLNAVLLADFIGGSICYGVKSGLAEAFVISADLAKKLRRPLKECTDVIRPYIVGRDIRRYSPVNSSNFLIYTFHGIDISPCNAILDHLQPYKQRLLQRATQQEWYELQQPQKRYVDLMKAPKIVYPDIAKDCRFAIDSAGYVCGDTTFAIPGSNLKLLALLNSRVAYFYFKCVCAALEGGNDTYLRFKSQYVAKFPIPIALNDGPSAVRLEIFAQQILTLVEKHGTVKTTHERTTLARQIEATDQEIDRLVYE